MTPRLVVLLPVMAVPPRAARGGPDAVRVMTAAADRGDRIVRANGKA